MTVRTQGNKVCNGIDFSAALRGVKRMKMMNLDKLLESIAVSFTEIDAANRAGRSMMLKAHLSSWALARAARRARHRKPPAQRVDRSFRYAALTLPL